MNQDFEIRSENCFVFLLSKNLKNISWPFIFNKFKLNKYRHVVVAGETGDGEEGGKA